MSVHPQRIGRSYVGREVPEEAAVVVPRTKRRRVSESLGSHFCEMPRSLYPAMAFARTADAHRTRILMPPTNAMAPGAATRPSQWQLKCAKNSLEVMVFLRCYLFLQV